MTSREINWRFAGGAATGALVILLWGWLRGYKGLEWIPLFLGGFVIPGLVAARTFQELRKGATKTPDPHRVSPVKNQEK